MQADWSSLRPLQFRVLIRSAEQIGKRDALGAVQRVVGGQTASGSGSSGSRRRSELSAHGARYGAVVTAQPTSSSQQTAVLHAQTRGPARSTAANPRPAPHGCGWSSCQQQAQALQRGLMQKRRRSKAAAAAAALVVLALLPCGPLAPCPVAAQLPDQGQLQLLASQCPVTVRYEVSLGQGQLSAPQVPIFVGMLTLQNNENYTIEEWRMGWQFPYGSNIKYQQDVFDSAITLLTPDSVQVIVESDTLNKTIPGQQQLPFSFLGTKGSGDTNATNPYNVGAIQNVVFNNLRCTMVNTAAAKPSQPKAPLPEAPKEAAPVQPTDVQVEYTPIEYVGQPIESTFTQFLVRVRNIRNTTAVDMSTLTMQYWFEGPVDGAPLFADYNLQQFFRVQCEWATTGCDSVSLAVEPGYQGLPGAAFQINITFTPKAGMLLPSGANAVPALFLGKGVDVMDLLVTLTTKQGVALLNSTQDYSFLDTPKLPVETNATIIPRRALPNPHIPAFLNGTHVWGLAPAPADPAHANDLLEVLTAPAPGIEAAADSQPDLPVGITCEPTKDGQGQNCGLAAIYCCEGAEEASPTIPDKWPPPLLSASGEPVPVPERGQVNEKSATSGSETPPAKQSPPLPTVQAASSNTASNSSGGSGGGSGGSGGNGAVIGAVAGGIAAAAIVAAGAGFLVLRRRRQQQQKVAAEKMLTLEAVSAQQVDPASDSGKDSTPCSSDSQAPLYSVPFGSANKAPGSKMRPQQLSAVVVPASQAQHVWGAQQPSPRGYFSGADVGFAQQSSPSKAGSQVPLLLRPQASLRSSLHGGGGSSALHKFPSGISGISSHDNPMFDTASEDGGGGEQLRTGSAIGSSFTQQSVLPQHVGSWEMQSAVLTQQAFQQAQRAAAEAAAGAGVPGVEDGASVVAAGAQAKEEAAQRAGILAVMEHKGATAPTLLYAPRNRQRRQRRSSDGGSRSRSSGIAAGGGSSAGADAGSGGGSSSSDDSEDDGVLGSGSGSGHLPDWQLKRSKSWDGRLQEAHTLGDSMPLFLRRRRESRQLLLHAIPPMPPLAPPVLPTSQPAPHVDLNVDYDTEVRPFLGRCLGTGGFGAVYEATWRGQRVAVKKLPQFGPDQPCSEGMYLALLREIELASKFSSDRLVRVYGACTSDREHVCLIMELLEGGNLFQRIYDRCKRRMGYLEILQLAHDVAAGLAYLHPSVVHRDLKPQNILLDADGRAKLADFGISRVKDPTKSYLSQVTNDNGTPMYMAPEQFNGSRVDEKVDVYALGVILNECYTRRQPWRDSSHFFQIILKVAINGERPWIDPDCPEPLRRLITKCWHHDPHMRPSCAEIMRLTAFMIQEEVHRWEQLQSAGSGGHTRLPTAARGGIAVGANGLRHPPVLPVPAPAPTVLAQQMLHKSGGDDSQC